jgi:phospholipid transport system substrate-binding protein
MFWSDLWHRKSPKTAGFSFVLTVGLFFVLLVPRSQAKVFTANDVKKIVATNTSILVNDFNREKKTYNQNPERFYAVMDQSLGLLVNFDRIAARVMGRFARQATPA